MPLLIAPTHTQPPVIPRTSRTGLEGLLSSISYIVSPCEGGTVDVLTWIIVGLVAGLLASLVMGGIGYGLLGDILIGVLGAVFGGWLFGQMGWGTPCAGLAGMIFVAFIGAVVLLLIVRLLSGARRAR